MAVPPNIAGTSNSQNLSVLQNQQAILECKLDAVPPPVLTWLKDGEILEVYSLCLLSVIYLNWRSKLWEGTQIVHMVEDLACKACASCFHKNLHLPSSLFVGWINLTP